MVGIPAKKTTAWLNTLGDRTLPLTAFQLQRIVRDARVELKRNPDDPVELYSVLGQAHFWLGMFEEARDEFNNVLLLTNQKQHDALLSRGACRLELLEYEGSYADLKAYVEVREDDCVGWANLAELFLRMGLREETHNCFREAIRLVGASEDPNDWVFLAMQGAALGLTINVVDYVGKLKLLLSPERHELLLASERMAKVRECLSKAELLGAKLGQLRPIFTSHTYEDSDEHARDALRVLEDMKPFRDRALQSAVAGGEDEKLPS